MVSWSITGPRERIARVFHDLVSGHNARFSQQIERFRAYFAGELDTNVQEVIQYTAVDSDVTEEVITKV
jgi:hypothetical protein